jgi:hypothetical protein
VALQHEGHRRSAETCRADVAMAVHRAEGRSLGGSDRVSGTPPLH